MRVFYVFTAWANASRDVLNLETLYVTFTSFSSSLLQDVDLDQNLKRNGPFFQVSTHCHLLAIHNSRRQQIVSVHINIVFSNKTKPLFGGLHWLEDIFHGLLLVVYK